MSALRFILVGLGARSRTWRTVIDAHPGARIVAACDPDPAARARAAEAHPGLPLGASLADVIGVEADAVLLSTPPHGRERDMDLCCAHGRAILAEKPLADDVALAARYVAMAESAGVLLIVGLNFRYLAVTQALRGLLREGAVGAPGFGRFTYERWRDGTLARLNSYPLTMAQPMLWEQSIHHFDLMRFVYGVEPLRVMAHTFNPPWSMYADDANVSALLDFEGDLSVNYQGTWQGGHDRLDFDWRTDCAEGIVVQRDMFGDLAMARRADPDLTEVPLPPHEPWISDARGLLDMVVAACQGTAPPECTGRDHLQSLYMLQACILSSARRSSVEIAEIRDTTGGQG